MRKCQSKGCEYVAYARVGSRYLCMNCILEIDGKLEMYRNQIIKEARTMERTAIIVRDIFYDSTGTPVPLHNKFLCWDDDPKAKELVKMEEDKGEECISIKIPYFNIKESPRNKPKITIEEFNILMNNIMFFTETKQPKSAYNQRDKLKQKLGLIEK